MARLRVVGLATVIAALVGLTSQSLAQSPHGSGPTASPPPGGLAATPAGIAASEPAAAALLWPTLLPPNRVPVPARFVPKGRPDAATTRHGVRVELWLSSPSAAPGEWLQALVRTTNLRDDPAWAMSGECGASATWLSVDLGKVIPMGEPQTGNAAAFKAQAVGPWLTTGFLPWPYLRRFYTLASDMGFAPVECPFGSRPRKLGAGASVNERFAWYPAGSFDGDVWFQPLPPGEITATVSWPFLGRGERSSTEARAPYRRAKPTRASTTIELTGNGPGTPSLPELVDIALEDPEFRAWVADHPARDPWPGVSVTGWPGPTYENHLWLSDLVEPPTTGILTLEQDRQNVNRGIISLDPWTGEVLDVRFLGPAFEPPR